MRSIGDALHAIAVTIWAGGLWTVGFIVAPLLFSRVPDRMLAGLIAGKLLSVMAYVGIACGLYLLAFRFARFGASCLKQGFFWIAFLMLVLVVVGEFGVHPILDVLRAQALPREVMHSVLRERFDTWHGVASALYVIVSVLGVALVTLQNRSLK
jgi:MFS family permease